MWNLLGGFAGLISVGQQAYIGIGAYGLWYFGDELHIHPFVAVFLRRRAGRGHRPAIAPLLFRLRGGYFAIGTWVFAEVILIIVSNVQATGGGSGKTVVSAALLPRDTRIFGTYWVGLAVAVGPSSSSTCCCAQSAVWRSPRSATTRWRRRARA